MGSPVIWGSPAATLLTSDLKNPGGKSAFNNVLGVATKTTTYTATTSDDLLLASTSGSAWTLTLHTAIGNTGKILEIIKTTSDTNSLTIDGAGSETIGGSTTVSMFLENEYIRIISDGSNWRILDRNSPWSSYTPTLGGITATSQSWRSMRVGNTLFTKGHIVVGTVSANPLSVSIHPGATIDTTGLTASGHRLGWMDTLEGPATDLSSASQRSGCAYDGSSTTSVTAAIRSTSGLYRLTETANSWLSNNEGLAFDFTIPIVA